mmetsp:Transcript_47330/g.119812  ORF Transcript_47330/g.119812 Transcript_47330/m.119812 type:complete len:137 (-) Transcript_47330:984-1394(-)
MVTADCRTSETGHAVAQRSLSASKLSQQRTLDGSVKSSITSPALLYSALRLKYKEDGSPEFDISRTFQKPLAEIGDDRHARRFMNILRSATNVLFKAMHPTDVNGQIELMYALTCTAGECPSRSAWSCRPLQILWW